MTNKFARTQDRFKRPRPDLPLRVTDASVLEEAVQDCGAPDYCAGANPQPARDKLVKVLLRRQSALMMPGNGIFVQATMAAPD